jgi:hypothetical protein
MPAPRMSVGIPAALVFALAAFSAQAAGGFHPIRGGGGQGGHSGDSGDSPAVEQSGGWSSIGGSSGGSSGAGQDSLYSSRGGDRPSGYWVPAPNHQDGAQDWPPPSQARHRDRHRDSRSGSSERRQR